MPKPRNTKTLKPKKPEKVNWALLMANFIKRACPSQN